METSAQSSSVTQIEITTGISNNIETEVLSGLSEGQFIVTRTIMTSASSAKTAASAATTRTTRGIGGFGGGTVGNVIGR